MRRDVVAFLSLLALSLLCYTSVLPSYFVSDDFTLIGRVADRGMFSTWAKSHGGFLRPVTVLSYMIDFKTWRFNQLGFHLTNVLLHAVNAFLVYLLFRSLYRLFLVQVGGILSFCAACLFLVLPSHTESVSWISGRTDVLATAFGLAATVGFVHLLPKRSVTLLCATLAFLSLSLLAKEGAVVFPVVWIILVLVYIVLAKRRPTSQALGTLVGAVVCLAAYFILRRYALGQFIGGYGAYKHLSIMNAGTLNNVFKFAIRTFLPAMTPRGFGMIMSRSAFLIVGFCVGAVICVLLFQRTHLHSKRWLEVATISLCLCACWGLSLVPALTMSVSLFDTQGERFLYLPSVFASGVAVLVASIASRSRRVTIVAISLCIVLEAVALQWVNRRWVTASRLSERIAGEVAGLDPNHTLILNIPDNFRGAYVFRNGLTEAATTFLGRPKLAPYRVISFHDVNSLEEAFDARVSQNSVHLSLPASLRFHAVNDHGLEVVREGNRIVVKDLDITLPEDISLVGFRGGRETPMFRAIVWNTEMEGAASPPPEAGPPPGGGPLETASAEVALP